MKNTDEFDVIVAGSGMGGMSAAAMLAADGYKVLILEAAHAPGGCSSSYYRKGYWFETGATTLVGFDKHQPLWKLEQKTGIRIPRQELRPSMQVHVGNTCVTRFKDRERWIRHAGECFGNPQAQRRFWELSLSVSEIVWKVSLKNTFFPPQQASDWWKLITNNDLRHTWVLPYVLRSVEDIMHELGLTNRLFRRFIDEQLMITAQAKADNVPFIFGAAALTYANYSNYYVPGGLLKMVETIQGFIESKGGGLHTKEPVEQIYRADGRYHVATPKARYTASVVVSNIPVWNMPAVTSSHMRRYFESEAKQYDEAWGAFTLGMITEDTYPDDLPLHHQLHVRDERPIEHTSSESVFVSLSRRGDEKRAETGKRVLNVSCHTVPESWYTSKVAYDRKKEAVEEQILALLQRKLPGFGRSALINVFSGTPVTWENWVYRKKGRVGGIPQRMGRSLFDWTPAKTPFKGLYLCGDTVYPGQGIPGVTLSGINAYNRITEDY